MSFKTIAMILVLVPILVLAADDPQFTSNGALVRPANYREWVWLSSGLGMSYGPLAQAMANEQPPFDNVFVNPTAYRAFLRTGKWPDKTVFILEVRSSVTKGSINRAGRFQGDLHGIEVEVKNEGHWTFFGFDGDTRAAKAIPRTASCYSCHAQNGAVDNTFVQFYPTLLPIAREKGTLKIEAETRTSR